MKLYIYEHCPFCVMTKMIFVLKNYPVEISYLLYDDIHGPMQMVGRKQLPILEYQQNRFMPESRDIINYIDTTIDKPKITLHDNEEIMEWISHVQRFIYRLTYPRWVNAPFPEFSTEEAKKYYRKKKDPSGGGFVSDLADPSLIQRTQKAIDCLEPLIKNYPLLDLKRQLSWNDFSLYSMLHSLSIIKGITYGVNVDRWRKKVSETCSIPLNDAFAN